MFKILQFYAWVLPAVHIVMSLDATDSNRRTQFSLPGIPIISIWIEYLTRTEICKCMTYITECIYGHVSYFPSCDFNCRIGSCDDQNQIKYVFVRQIIPLCHIYHIAKFFALLEIWNVDYTSN